MVGLDEGSGALVGRFRLVAGRGIVVDDYLQEYGDGEINIYK